MGESIENLETILRSDRDVRELDAWIQVSLVSSQLPDLLVSFSEKAHKELKRRHGAYCICLTWDEFKALALGVNDAPEGQRFTRLAEAVRYFGSR